MPNKEYVIGCLKYLHDRETWREGPLVSDDHAEARRRITADALALLREQEPVEPIRQEGYSSVKCGKCNSTIPLYCIYCPVCGRKVKWDGDA